MSTIVMVTDITGNAIARWKERAHAMRSRGLLLCEAIGDKLPLRMVDDVGEGLRIEAGSANQRAVDIFQNAEKFRVVGFDRTAVEDADGSG